MMDIKLIIFVFATCGYCSFANNSQISAAYLQDTIKDLKMMAKRPNNIRNHKSPGSLTVRRAYDFTTEISEEAITTENILSQTALEQTPSADNKVDVNGDKMDRVPSLHLTKAELAALYESALHKGETIKLETDNSRHPLTAAVHELNADGTLHKGVKNPDAGYYYYYYPLKSFLHELTSAVGHGQMQKTGHKPQESIKTSYYHHPSYYHHSHYDKEPHLHSHTHQHNVHIETTKPTMMAPDDNKKKGLEPLFMAISGFIGMTIMFILSVLVLPKFKKLKPKEFREEDDFFAMGRVALQAIEGYDCGERFACEAGKAVNAFHVYDNRFVKFLRRFAPISLAKQIDKVGKYRDKRYKCAVIECKKRELHLKNYAKANDSNGIQQHCN